MMTEIGVGTQVLAKRLPSKTRPATQESFAE